MNRLVEQIGSGRKFLTPADDPLAAALSINVAQTQSMNATYQLNRNTAKTNLGQESNVLDSVTTALSDVRTRVVQAGNGTFGQRPPGAVDRAQERPRSVLGLANSTDGNGQYMFSGYQGSAAPYAQNAAARSCIAAPPANAPFRLINRARCPPATWARISSAGRTPARRVTSARPRPAIPARPSSARPPSRRVAPT